MSDVKRVVWDLGRDIERPLLRTQSSTPVACLTSHAAVSAMRCDKAEVVKSSACEVVRSSSVGWSAKKKLKGQGERTEPYGTPGRTPRVPENVL